MTVTDTSRVIVMRKRESFLLFLAAVAGILILPTVVQARTRTASDLGSRVAALEADNAAQAATIADQEDRIAALESVAMNTVTGFVNGDGSIQDFSRSGVTVTRNGPGDYTIDYPAGTFFGVDGTGIALPIAAFSPREPVFAEDWSAGAFNDGSGEVTVEFRDALGVPTDTQFGVIVTADASQ